jgi:hypothetical protein
VAEGVLEMEHRHALVDAPGGEGVAELVGVAVDSTALLQTGHQTRDAVAGEGRVLPLRIATMGEEQLPLEARRPD